ncbi:MAG: ATP-binding cassette domain-containing protein [Anaerolineae bacterium]|nr:ATP-binding cassette domain-containing protein [Anaerolineae bacterium]
MSVITVQNLSKTFQVKGKAAGVKASFKSLFRPQTSEIHAVKGISFDVQEGERVAFIGPNGAGKSTTIKMLVGILFPTDGQASVLGKVPWREREKLAYQIGAVFGQKSQLWYHLPPQDTFDLLARIYELAWDGYKKRLAQLVDLFEIGDLMATPVRKLSLGQRMRCEIAASLLHGPRILFLDEPTIGLDVVVKHRIRELILRLNEEEKVTVFLTSHDAGDVERLCRRAMVINHGEVIYDGKVSTLKRDYIRSKTVSLKLGEPFDGFEMEGVTVLKAAGSGVGVKLEVDTATAGIDQVIARLMARYPILDMTVEDPPMEQVIAHIYGEEANVKRQT